MEESTQQLTTAELLKKIRKQKKITQEKLCDASGISFNTYKKYETGVRNPKPEQLQKIADALGVSVNVFMPPEVKNNIDILSALIQLDREAGLQWEFKKDIKGNIIPETVAISFKDYDLNVKLAEYIQLRKKAKTPLEQRRIDRLLLYSSMEEASKDKK